jgi:ribosomal protein S18 acetylase RimI-like enzyme
LENQGFRVEPAIEADAQVVAGYIRKMLEYTASLGGYSGNRSEDRWGEVGLRVAEEIRTNRRHAYFLAKDDTGRPIGLGAAQITDAHLALEPCKTLHVSTLYVEPGMRRSGIGKRILEELITFGKAGGVDEIDLGVEATNPAVKLYLAAGFRIQRYRMVLALKEK